jgi:hypothetical protein
MARCGFLKRSMPEVRDHQTADRGFLVFENTIEVIQGENILKSGGWNIRVMGPPLIPYTPAVLSFTMKTGCRI